ERIAVLAAEPPPTATPTILVHDRHSSPRHTPGWEASRRPRFSTLIAAKLQRAVAVWRRHLERDTPNIKAGPRRSGNVSGGAIALLSFLLLVICAGAVVALTQIRALKSEVANLQRE